MRPRSVPFGHVHLAFEAAVDEDNVTDGEDHAEGPPDEPDGQRVRAGDGTGKCDVAVFARGGRKQRGIHAPASAGQHKEQIEARSKESFDGRGLVIPEPKKDERNHDAHRDDKADGIARVVVEAGRAHADGGDEADDGEYEKRDPERLDEIARTVSQVAGHFDGEPQRSVESESDKRNETADDGVPVEDAGAWPGWKFVQSGRKK